MNRPASAESRWPPGWARCCAGPSAAQVTPSAPALTGAANALGPDADRALAPIVRREVVRVLVRAPAGVAPTTDSVRASLRWSWPRRGGRLRDDVVDWSLEEAELLGLTGRGAMSSFGRSVCAVVLDDPAPGVEPAVAAAARRNGTRTRHRDSPAPGASGHGCRPAVGWRRQANRRKIARPRRGRGSPVPRGC